jgi:Ca-activated chloride channel homolog
MQRPLFLILAVAALPLFGSFQQSDGQQGQQDTRPSPQIRVEVDRVNILVTVLDKQGRFVTDLPQSRFTILEDKVPQDITNFARETSLPLSVALLIDTSASVRLKLDFQKRAAAGFLHRVLRLEDQAMLVEFDTGATLLHDFTNRPGLLVEELRSLRAGGGTALFDSLYKVADEKLIGASPRRVIVIVSDGADLHSTHTLEQAIEMVQRSDATVYAIGTSRFGASPEKGGEQKLRTLTEQTGGKLFLPYSEAQFEEAFDQLNDELRSQYSLTYEPKNKSRDGRFRQISVKVKDDKGLAIRYRKGYYPPREDGR